MSNLSQFMRRTYPGLTQTGGQLNFTANTPDFALQATDPTATGQPYPVLRLINNYQAGGAGGQILFHGRNGAGAQISHSGIQGSLDTLTAGLETSRLTLTALVAGGARGVALRGDITALSPVVSAGFSLGMASLRWNGAYIGDATGAAAGDFVPIGTTAVGIGSATGVPLWLRVNGVAVARLAQGAMALGGSSNPDGSKQLWVTGVHPGPGNIVAGVQYDGLFPLTATSLAASFRSAPSTAAASFTLNELAHFYAGFVATQGAGSTINSEVGLHVGALGSGITVYGVKIDVPPGANNYAIYAGGGSQSFFAGAVGIGGLAPANTVFSASPAFDDSTVGLLSAPSSSFAGTLLLLKAGANGGVGPYDAISLRDPNNATTFLLRGDGVAMCAPAGTAAARLNNALFSIKGRLAQSVNSTFDLNGNTTAATFVIDGSLSVGPSQRFDGVRVTPSISPSGSAVSSGITADMTVVGGDAATQIIGVSGKISTSGAGTSYGVAGGTVALPGHSGTLIGGYFWAAPQPGSIVTLLNVQAVTRANTAILVNAFNNGDTLISGLAFQSNLKITGDVISYGRSTGATANFLRLTDEAVQDRFIVDKDGNIISAALTVFNNADVALGPAGATTVMTTGFPCIPYVGGTPTGVPVGRTGHVQLIYDTAANKIWVYNGAWKSTAALT